MGHAGLVPVLHGERVGGAMRLMQPRHICRLIGHRCESYIGPRRSYATASAQRTE